MSGRPRTTLTGFLRYLRAVAASDLDGVCKAVLFGLSPHVDVHTWEARPSLQRIADNAGIGRRAVCKGIRQLREARIVHDVKRSRGGPRQTNVIRVDLDVLEARNCAPGALLELPLPPQRCTEGTLTVHQVRSNGAPRAHEHTNEQTIEHTTTTGEVGASIPPAVPVGGGDGGGASLLAVGSEKTAERGHCPQESEGLLVAFGVSKSKATVLAAVYPAPVVEAGIAWVQLNARDTNSPQGVLVHILEDGTAEAYRQTLDRERARREEEELRTAEAARLVHVAGLISKLLHRVGEGLSDKSQQNTYGLGMAVIRAAWPAPLDAARSGVLSEADLTDPAAKPNALFNRLVRAAKAEVKARGTPPAEEPISPIEGTTGGTP